MNTLENLSFNELTPGTSITLERQVTERDIILFAAVSGDINPVHLDPDYAGTTRFGEQIAHGMFAGALISAALATRLPGPGTIYRNQTLKFQHPVKIGDTLTVRLTVEEKRERHGQVTIRTEVINQDGKSVVTGKATVIAPAEKISVPAPDLPSVTVAGIDNAEA